MIIAYLFLPSCCAEKLNTFVRVILQNVTLETDVDKGGSPTWDEEFVL